MLILTLVVTDDIERAVVKVIATAYCIIAAALITPALPTIHGWRIYQFTPRIVNTVELKTPAIVPKGFLQYLIGTSWGLFTQ